MIKSLLQDRTPVSGIKFRTLGIRLESEILFYEKRAINSKSTVCVLGWAETLIKILSTMGAYEEQQKNTFKKVMKGIAISIASIFVLALLVSSVYLVPP